MTTFFLLSCKLDYLNDMDKDEDSSDDDMFDRDVYDDVELSSQCRFVYTQS